MTAQLLKTHELLRARRALNQSEAWMNGKVLFRR
jgi:hypothetical protein